MTWEPADSEATHIARMAGRVPPPVLVEIGVFDPDSARGSLSPRSQAGSVTTTAWCGLTGLIAGGATGIWFWGMTVATLVLAVAGAAGAVAAAAVWQWLAASIRPPVRILTERDAAAAAVFEGAKVLTSVTDPVLLWLWRMGCHQPVVVLRLCPAARGGESIFGPGIVAPGLGEPY